MSVLDYETRTAILEAMPDEAWSLLCKMADEQDAVVEDFAIEDNWDHFVIVGPNGESVQFSF